LPTSVSTRGTPASATDPHSERYGPAEAKRTIDMQERGLKFRDLENTKRNEMCWSRISA